MDEYWCHTVKILCCEEDSYKIVAKLSGGYGGFEVGLRYIYIYIYIYIYL